MPRIRSIKPEFWTSGQILECSTNARLLFIGLWNFCDDAGRHPFRPKQIKAEVFPADDFTSEDILGMLDELSSNDLIMLYEYDNKQFLQVKGWHHQRIDKPQDPKNPDPFDEHSKIIQGAFPPDRIGRDRIGKERSGEEGKGGKEADASSSDVEKPTPEAKYVIPLTAGKEHPVTQEDIDKYHDLFPAVDVDQAIRNMLAWLDSNPQKRSGSARGAKTRMTSWLSREQDKASRNPNQAGGGGDSVDQQVRAAREYRERQKRLIEGETTNERQ